MNVDGQTYYVPSRTAVITLEKGFNSFNLRSFDRFQLGIFELQGIRFLTIS